MYSICDLLKICSTNLFYKETNLEKSPIVKTCIPPYITPKLLDSSDVTIKAQKMANDKDSIPTSLLRSLPQTQRSHENEALNLAKKTEIEKISDHNISQPNNPIKVPESAAEWQFYFEEKLKEAVEKLNNKLENNKKSYASDTPPKSDIPFMPPYLVQVTINSLEETSNFYRRILELQKASVQNK